jgi:hypothetical protein
MGSGQISLKTGSDHHLYFFAFLKKITTTGSSANFLSPKPNGQGYYSGFQLELVEKEELEVGLEELTENFELNSSFSSHSPDFIIEFLNQNVIFHIKSHVTNHKFG